MYDFTVLALDGAYGTSVCATLDILSAAEALAPAARSAAPRWRTCTVKGSDIQLSGGVRLRANKLPTPSGSDTSIWVVPGLGVGPDISLAERLERPDALAAADALRRHVDLGGRVAASCSAVFLLHAAGLLSGRRVTTSWWLAPKLQRMAPESVVDANRMICVDGPVTTAGAAFAQTDLMLQLLRSRMGGVLADSISKMLLIDGRQAQAPFIVPEMLAGGDDLAARIAARVEAALPTVPSVAELAQEFCMTERTLARRLHRATGKSTLALIHSVKLRRARILLESSRMSIEQIAEAVGYSDSTALRRLMKKVAGANPSHFRHAVGYR